jgi:hypothetical protein
MVVIFLLCLICKGVALVAASDYGPWGGQTQQKTLTGVPGAEGTVSQWSRRKWS